MRTEDQINARAFPFQRPSLTVAALICIAGQLPVRTHVQQADEEVVRQRAHSISEDATPAVIAVGAQHAQATHQHGHLWRRQSKQLSPVQQQFLGGMRRPPWA